MAVVRQLADRGRGHRPGAVVVEVVSAIRDRFRYQQSQIEIGSRKRLETERIDRRVAHDHGHPANRRRSIRIEVRRVPPDLQICILKNVLQFGSACAYRAGRFAHLPASQRIKFGERGVFACAGPCDQQGKMVSALSGRCCPDFHPIYPSCGVALGWERCRRAGGSPERGGRTFCHSRRRRCGDQSRTKGLIRRPKKPFMRRSPVMATRQRQGSPSPTIG